MNGLFVCSRWDSLCEIGYTDDRVYRTREDAEKRADRITYDDDLVSYHVTVDELRPCWKPDDLDMLRDENEKLRESYENLRNAMWDKANARAIDFMAEDELRVTYADLYDYIDELKELARDMYATIEVCDGGIYPSNGAKRAYVWRMRDLGIEVGG